LAQDTTAQETLLQQLGHTYRELVAAFERHMGMSRARWVILNLLGREQTATQALIGQRLRVDAAAITRQVKLLEKEGLVTRRPDPKDNRYTLVTLTPQGMRYVDGLRPHRDLFEAIVTAGLSEEETITLRRSLTRLRDNIQHLPEQR
jgi:DNA-binding MarR family transcriptional regulator